MIGEIKEVGAGYTFFWSGRKSEERLETGVGFVIKSDLVRKLTGLPNGINDRLMTSTKVPPNLKLRESVKCKERKARAMGPS